MSRRSDLKQERDRKIKEQFDKMFNIDKIQYQECLNRLSKAYFLAITTIEGIIQKQTHK